MKRIWFLLVCAGVLVATNVCADTRMMPLDGDGWTIASDPDNSGKANEWWKQAQPAAKPIRVPGVMQESLPGYHGVAWYWKTFTAPANPNELGRYILRFGVVDYFAEVWVNDVRVGDHDGGETPFSFDVTDAIKPQAENLLTVRVINATDKPIDGIALAETPHRNKYEKLTVGGTYNYGGITEPVELAMVPAVRIQDIFIRPDWKTGKCRIQTTLRNTTTVDVPVTLSWSATPGNTAEVLTTAKTTHTAPPGDSVVEPEILIPDFRLWDLDNPVLYALQTSLTSDKSNDAHRVRFGFRDFRVVNGYFMLNGKRIFLKSSHTGNHCPVGQIVSPAEAADLLRRDLIYTKTCGFNMIRFIAGVPHPYQLDVCDEIGLMAFTETLAGWQLGESPRMAERFDLSTRDTLLRDRNHPSFTLFGLLNENMDNPIFRHAVDSLKLVRSVDDTRLVLLGSGRWDGQSNIGSLSNPGGTEWEHQWGIEDPAWQPKPAQWSGIGGYMSNAGDAHVYPVTPHTPEVEQTIRTLGKDTKPIFLSEYGIGSLMNIEREFKTYRQHRIDPNADDYKYFQTGVEKLNADWQRFGLDGVYAFPDDMLHDSQRLHIRQRLLGFDLIRSNPKICGYNLTGLLDHGFTGEGLWTYWREFKPGIVDALRDGWAPLRWCTFVSPMHGYLGAPFKVEVFLANEDSLQPGEYPVTLRILGDRGIVWEQKSSVVVPEAKEGEFAPFSLPVYSGDVTLQGDPGAYELAVSMDDASPAGGRLKFRMTAPPQARSGLPTVLCWGLDDAARGVLEKSGLKYAEYEGAPEVARQTILIGDVSAKMADEKTRLDLLRRVAQGSTAVFLTPAAFRNDDNAGAWLPMQNKGSVNNFSDWLYHKECIAKIHPAFNGLQSKGIMDWDFYGPIISHTFIENADAPQDIAAVAIAVCHSSRPADGYASGIMLGAYNVGAGKAVINTFNVLENLGKHPAADRMLVNLVEYAAATASEPATNAAGDFEELAKQLGYK